MPVDELLYDAAVALIESRLPSADWATAAALRMDDGSIIVGIGFDNFNSGAGLCAEVGPIAQAYTEGRRVTDLNLREPQQGPPARPGPGTVRSLPGAIGALGSRR